MNLSAYLPQDRLFAIDRYGKLADWTTGAVLFADISGFTALTESLTRQLGERRGIEELARQINLVYDALIAGIERLGGSVISFAGDAITCWFDDSDGNGPAPLRSVSAAFMLQEIMQGFPVLGLKVAVASGKARRFLVGDPDIHYIDSLAGDTVSRTAIAEHLANRGDIMIDEATAGSLDHVLQIREWRSDEHRGERFGVAERLAISADPGKIPAAPEVSASTLRPYIHPAVYEREVSGLGSFLTEFRPCVALFLRFTGIDYDAEDAVARLDSFIRLIQTIVDRHGGAVLQLIIGDKGSYLYINFGVLNMHEDDAQRAMRSAMELRGSCDLCLQIGITTGVMRVGTYGGSTRCTYGALGDDVNLSARLMMNAAPGEILVSSAIYKTTDLYYSFEPRSPLPMKGKAEPVPIFVVTGERQQRAIRLQEPTYSLPMVGRRNELKLIEDKLDLALNGQPQVIGITADAGLGKSRLVAEAIRSARRKGFVGYGGACQADGIHSPYQAWKSIWNAFFDVDPGMSPSRMTRFLERELEVYAPRRLNALPLLGNLLGMNIPDNEFTAMLEPKIRQSALHALLEDCLKSAANEEPLLIVIEDFHWIDPLSHDLLEEMVRALSHHRVCFIFSYRPMGLASKIAPRLRSLPRFIRIELHELDASDAVQAIRAKLAQLYPARSGDAVLPELVTKLMARSQGNPFFLEELLNFLRDRGLDPRDPADLNKIELPQNLHTLILSRLDQLIDRQKTILRLASIVGRVFPVAWLTGYYPELGEPSQIMPDLDELHALEITSPDTSKPELTYLFKHIVLHEVTYESLPFATRAKLHEQLAHYLETEYQDALPLDALAFHYSRSENVAKQREYLLKAGEAAQRQFANVAALAYYGQLLQILESAAEKIPVYLERGNVLEASGSWEEAESDYHKALNLCQKQQDLISMAHAKFAIGKLRRLRGDYTAALEWLEKAKSDYASLVDQTGQGRTLAETGMVFWREGDYTKSRKALNESLVLARAGGDRQGQAQTLNNLGNVALWQGDTTTARSVYMESLEIHRAIGDKVGIATSLNNLGNVAIWLNDGTRAKSLYEEGLALRREIGDRGAIAISLGNVGAAAFALGEYQLSRELQEESLVLKRVWGDKYGIAISLTNLGSVSLAQGDAKAAQAYQNESLKVCRESGDKPIMAYALLGLGMALLPDASGSKEVLAESRRNMVESLHLRLELGEQSLVMSSLIGLAGYWLTRGNDYHAAMLLSAAAIALKTLDAAFEPDISYFYEKTLAEIRSRLGDLFQPAWEAGEKLSLAEAVSFAQEDAGNE